jgi:hypothetical protein
MKHLAEKMLKNISKLVQLQNHTACFAFSAMEERKFLCWN